MSCAHAGAPAPDAALTPASREQAGAEPGLALRENTAGELSASAATQTSSEASPTPKASNGELPRGTLVLHVGDSFAGSLGEALGKRLKAAGVRSVLQYRDASYIPTWSDGPDLGSYIARYSPDLVIITLGANEFELTAPDTRANAVRRLVRRLEGRPCVWVTPPRWKPDSGILAVIHANAAPCRFLDSDTIVHDLPRKKDRIHPSDPAREIWADAVINWLAQERDGGAERPWQLRLE